jgi:hypothetical protein
LPRVFCADGHCGASLYLAATGVRPVRCCHPLRWPSQRALPRVHP